MSTALTESFQPAQESSTETLEARLPVLARRVLALGLSYQVEQVPVLLPWQDPATTRGAIGVFHMKRASMARRLRCSMNELRHALDVLTKQGLHWYAGWRLERVETTRRGKVYVELREVPVRIFTDPATVTLLPKKNHGGRRAGAGRPRKVPEMAKIGASPTPEGNQVLPANDTHAQTQTRAPETPSPRSLRGADAAFDSFGRTAKRKLAPAGFKQALAKFRFVPADPACLVVMPCFRAPPRLPADLDEAGRVAWLVEAYRGAHLAMTGRESWFGRRGALSRPARGLLVRAGEALLDFDVAPAAWCLFSGAQWQRVRAVVGEYPPAPWAYSTLRMGLEPWDWREEVRDFYGRQRNMSPPLHMKLCEDFQFMRDDLRRLPELTETAARAVVEHYFPGSTFEERLAAAKAEALSMQRRADHIIETGGFPWR